MKRCTTVISTRRSGPDPDKLDKHGHVHLRICRCVSASAPVKYFTAQRIHYFGSVVLCSCKTKSGRGKKVIMSSKHVSHMVKLTECS